jgi:hypothetical protein
MMAKVINSPKFSTYL